MESKHDALFAIAFFMTDWVLTLGCDSRDCEPLPQVTAKPMQTPSHDWNTDIPTLNMRRSRAGLGRGVCQERIRRKQIFNP
jgi:hypothetical protein